MKYLLDTHIFIWWLIEYHKLPKKIIEIIKNPNNELYLSAISSWEMCIKIQLKKLKLPEKPIDYIPKKLNEHSILALNITHQHTTKLLQLPLIHKDPFDRILISQTITENMILLSCDNILKRYPVKIISH